MDSEEGFVFLRDIVLPITENKHRMWTWRMSQKYNYVGLQQRTYPRVVIIDKLSEIVVLEVREGVIIFPNICKEKSHGNRE